jgi:hypothetical protein
LIVVVNEERVEVSDEDGMTDGAPGWSASVIRLGVAEIRVVTRGIRPIVFDQQQVCAIDHLPVYGSGLEFA